MSKPRIVNDFEIEPFAKLVGANLHGAGLNGADLHGADLTNAELGDAGLYGALLYHANLRGARLNGADLRGANLRGANLHGARLNGADLRGADLDFSCWTLWCGTRNVTLDIRQQRQLLAHVIAVSPDMPWTKKLRAEANLFHKIEEFGQV